jgi:hypothetical protein
MSEPGTSFRKMWPKDLTEHRFGISFRTISNKELEEKVQPVGGPRGPQVDHSSIYDDLGLPRRERWGPADKQEEEDYRAALIEKAIKAEKRLPLSYRKKA